MNTHPSPRVCPGFRSSLLFIPIATLLCLIGSIGPSSGAVAPTNTLAFSEVYAERLVCARPPGGVLNCAEAASDRFTVTAKMLLNGVDIASFTSNTVFDLRLGALHIAQRLGDDPAYIAGRKAAKFVSVTRNTNGAIVASRTVRLTWTTNALIVLVQARTLDVTAAGWASILANTYAGHVSGRLADNVNGTISLGGTNVSFQALPITGSVVTRNALGRDHQRFSLSSASIRSKGAGARAPVFLPVEAFTGTDSPITSMMIHNSGGTITVSTGNLAGVTLGVPPGAVSGDTMFIVAQNSGGLTPRSGTFPGQVLSIHTDGQNTFEEPLLITIPYTNSANAIPVPYCIDANGLLQPCQVVSVDAGAGTLSFETFHASLYTWLYAYYTGEGGHTTYKPSDGFQIVNYGSVYNPGGECFGISAFAQWFFANKGGGLYPKYMQDIPVPGGGTVKGQNIIATRAHTSVSRLWSSYYPRVSQQFNLTAAQRFAVIINILDNTARPAILYLSADPNSTGTHAVLAYDHNDSGTLAINDPNVPGQRQTAQLSGDSLTYPPYQSVTVIGNGSLRTESFENIYRDAQSGFSGNGAAQVNVTSHTPGEHVSERTITLAGRIESGQVLVDQLEVWLNQVTKFEQAIGPSGYFSLPINLVAGENRMTFLTKGHSATNNNVIPAPNTQRAPFVINVDSSNTVILVTLTWDTDDTDLDLYTIDPTGDYSAYYHHTTADGGELDFDDTTGFGPEHWTLAGDDTVEWGSDYDVRIHYYSDHDGVYGPAVATRWNVSVLLYEGTARAVNYNFTGVLAYDGGGSNDGPLNSGPDWADVCTITPVAPTATLNARLLEKSALGGPRILVPVISAGERLDIKTQMLGRQRPTAP